MKKITTFFIGVLIIVIILVFIENQFNSGIPVIRFVLNKYSEDNWIEVSKFIGLCISGWLLLWQAILAGIRTEQGNKNIEIQLNNAIEERFNNAITLIGNDNAATRLGAIYALDHIAKDTYNKEKSYTKTIFQIFCSYIRETTNIEVYKNNFKDKPSVEIQTIIDLLFKSHLNNFNGYIELEADLSYSYLCGADFSEALCKRAFFRGAHFEGAFFRSAHCEDADFFEAHCKDTIFRGAHCEKAFFREAHCEGAVFLYSHCNGTNFMKAHFEGADFRYAHCEDADFSDANCAGADFSYAHCTGACFIGAHCEGADFNNTKKIDLFGSIGTPKNMP